MIEHIRDYVLPAAYQILPSGMRSAEATALLLAIGLQESRFMYRAQIGGPARGFWQFERTGGVAGVLHHSATADLAQRAGWALRYPELTPSVAHEAIEHNDVLAAVFARLLLWTVPGRLPKINEPQQAWQTYLLGWRPGKPHAHTWPGHYTAAWSRLLLS